VRERYGQLPSKVGVVCSRRALMPLWMSAVAIVTGWASASHCSASSNPPRELCPSPALVSRVAIGAARATPSATSSAIGGAATAVVYTSVLMVIGQPDSMVAQIRTALTCGRLRVAGNGDIDGVHCIKLVEKAEGITLTYWVSRSAYLPVRLVTQFTQWPGPQTEQDDFSWLPPTRADLALVTVAIPPGFRQVAPPEQP